VRAVHIKLGQRLRLLYARSVLVRVMVYCACGLVVGSAVIYIAEHRDNPEYHSYFQTVVNIIILFTSGFDVGKPQSTVGTVAAFAVLAMGVCFLGLFTGEVAAWLVERRMKGRDGMKAVNCSGHIVITRWSKDTEAIVDELMSDEIKERSSIVVIDREIHELSLNNPYVEFVRGDATDSEVLTRAGVPARGRQSSSRIPAATTTTRRIRAPSSRSWPSSR
jgi:hypothetical protein